MSGSPAKFLPYFLIIFLIFWVAPGLCSQKKLSELQKQARVYRAKGYELQKKDNLEEALSYYQKAVLLDPSYAAAYNDLGIIFEALCRQKEAKEMYLKAITIDPAYANSYSNLALLYEAGQDYNNAILYWIKRRDLRSRRGPWVKTIKKHLEELARLHPEAYNNATGGAKVKTQAKEGPKVKNLP